MGLLDTLLGRSKPVPPDLDALFALPSAAVTLQAALGLTPTGTGAVSVKVTEGAAYVRGREEALALLRADGTTVQETHDDFGFAWLTARGRPDALPALVTGLHGANTAFVGAGLGPALLCTTVGFTGVLGGETRSVGLVYLFKRGTFYPFVPTGAQRRDNALELQVRGALGSDLAVEPDLSRWFPVWGAPLA